jgi:nicotinamidase-related amidase
MEKQDNEHTALLVMDVQGATVKALEDKKTFFASLQKAIAAARENNIPVMYVVVGFRKGYPEVSPENKMFASLLSGERSLDKEEDFKVAEEVAPLPGDILITKRRVSAFAGSDLEVVLRALQIQHMVLAGIATSGVVLSTIRQAADKDYVITVLSDCCADRDEEVHRVLTAKVFPRQAAVMTAEDWSHQLAK